MEQPIEYRVGHILIKDGTLIRLTSEELSFLLKCQNPTRIYKPILLTDNILRFFGFQLHNQFGSNNSYYKLIFEHSTIFLRFDDLTGSYYCSNYNNYLFFKYFHELQDYLYVNFHILLKNVNLSAFNQAVK